MLSFNPTRICRCHHHSRNDGSTTSGGETLNQTQNKQNLNPIGAAATDYKEYKDMGSPLDAVLLGSDMIHDPNAKICYRNSWTGFGKSTSFWFNMIPVPLEI
jgi:hypothetical protein